MTPAMAPTDIIRRTVVEMYRGRVVEIKWGQILLAGKSAIKMTATIGNNISAEIDNAQIAQPPLAFTNELFWPDKDEFKKANFEFQIIGKLVKTLSANLVIYM